LQNFVVDLNSYPSAFFFFLMAVGLYLVRNQRKRLNIPESTKGHRFRAWHIALIFTIFVNLYLLIMPWYPPAAGRDGGDVSFWYAAYVVTGIGIIVACFVYWTSWVHFIPRWRGYRIQHEKVVLDGGEVTHKLIKVPHDKLNEWNNEHDAQGRKLGHDDEFGRAGSDKETVDVEQ
jgi:amino acid transporter